MTRRNLRSNPAPVEVQNGMDVEKEDGPVSLGATEGSESFSKVNGTTSPTKKARKDLKDVPLKERLKAAREKENGSEVVISSLTHGDDAAAGGSASTSNKDPSKLVEAMEASAGKGESLAILLDQGLTSGDAQKIDAVLSKTDVQTISATLNDLPVIQILPLLKQIEYRLRNRSMLDIRCWIRWVQYIVSMHMAYLSTLGTLQDELKSLFEWMKSRSAHMGKLLELYGKLALVSEQVERRANPRLYILQEPKIFFTGEEMSSSEDGDDLDELDENESIASNDDWWDDEEIASDADQDAVSDSDDERGNTLKGEGGSSDEDTSGGVEDDEGDEESDVMEVE